MKASLMSVMAKIGWQLYVCCATVMAQAAAQQLTYHEQVLSP